MCTKTIVLFQNFIAKDNNYKSQYQQKREGKCQQPKKFVF